MADSKRWRVGQRFYRKRRKAWYCMMEGPGGERQERRLLKGPDDKETADEAENQRQKLRDQIEAKGAPTLDCTVDHLVQSFLKYVEANNAPGTLRNYLIQAFAKRGGYNSLRDAVDSTRRHNRCGEIVDADFARSIVVRCERCQENFDQDVNAARNLLTTKDPDAENTPVEETKKGGRWARRKEESKAAEPEAEVAVPQ